MSRVDLDLIQAQLKVAIQSHQVVFPKFLAPFSINDSPSAPSCLCTSLKCLCLIGRPLSGFSGYFECIGYRSYHKVAFLGLLLYLAPSFELNIITGYAQAVHNISVLCE